MFKIENISEAYSRYHSTDSKNEIVSRSYAKNRLLLSMKIADDWITTLALSLTKGVTLTGS